MREIKEQKWYKKLKGPVSLGEDFILKDPVPTAFPSMEPYAGQEMANEADKSLRRMKEGRRPFGAGY